MSDEPIGRFDHIGIAVHSIDEAREFFENTLGASFRYLQVDRRGGFRFAVFDLDGFTIELLDPVDPRGFLAKFLEQRGEGVHHITLQTPELKKKVFTDRRRRWGRRRARLRGLLAAGGWWARGQLHEPLR